MLAHFLAVRDVPLSRGFYADIHAAYEHWSAKDAQFLTEPRDRKAELRC